MKRVMISLLVALIFASLCYGGNVPKTTFDHNLKKQTVDSLSAKLDSAYVFPEKAAQMVKLIKGNLLSGKYKNISDPDDFAQRLTEDLQSISHDLHLNVRYDPEQAILIKKDTLKDKLPVDLLKRWQSTNYGFVKIEYLPGNIGYLDLRVFADPKIPEAGSAAVSAMNYLSNSRAIIFDLRKNGGGYAEMIQLITSYLFTEPTHLNDIYERPGNTTQQFWTLPHIPGPRCPQIPVYILTSSYTFSGAEEFSNNLKELKRATIVGEVTGGGAHPVSFMAVNDLFTVSLPFGRAINPISKSNWEGTGVVPHIRISADSAFNIAYLMALDTLINSTSGDQDVRDLKNTRLLKQAEFSNYRVPENILKCYAGIYGTRTVFYDEGNIYLLRPKRPRLKLLPLTDSEFIIDVIGGKIKFISGSDGITTGMEYFLPSGETLTLDRQK